MFQMSVIQPSIPFKSRKRTCRTNKNQEGNENINILNKIELAQVNQKHHIEDIDLKIKDDCGKSLTFLLIHEFHPTLPILLQYEKLTCIR